MKAFVLKLGFLFLFLSCLFSLVPASKADIVTKEGTTAAYKPYIISPSNMVYYNILTLNVSFRAEVWGNVKYTMVYSLDGQENESLPLTDHYFSWVQGEHGKCYVDGLVALPELADGSHTITVYLQCDWAIGYSTGWEDNYYNDSQTVFFTIISTTSPSLTPTPSPDLSPSLSLSPSIYPEQLFLVPSKSASPTYSTGVVNSLNPALVIGSIVVILAATATLFYLRKDTKNNI